MFFDDGTMFIMAQVFGAIAVSLEALAYQCRTKKCLLIFVIICTIFYAIQFFLLKAYSGCLVQFLVIARSVCILVKDNRQKEWNSLLYIFIALYIIVGIITFDSWYSIISVLASMIFLIADWKFKDVQTIRRWSIVGKILWLIYDICVISIPGVIATCVNLVSIGIGMGCNKQRAKRPTTKKKKKTLSAI